MLLHYCIWHILKIYYWWYPNKAVNEFCLKLDEILHRIASRNIPYIIDDIYSALLLPVDVNFNLYFSQFMTFYLIVRSRVTQRMFLRVENLLVVILLWYLLAIILLFNSKPLVNYSFVIECGDSRQPAVQVRRRHLPRHPSQQLRLAGDQDRQQRDVGTDKQSDAEPKQVKGDRLFRP